MLLNFLKTKRQSWINCCRCVSLCARIILLRRLNSATRLSSEVTTSENGRDSMRRFMRFRCAKSLRWRNRCSRSSIRNSKEVSKNRSSRSSFIRRSQRMRCSLIFRVLNLMSKYHNSNHLTKSSKKFANPKSSIVWQCECPTLPKRRLKAPSSASCSVHYALAVEG